MASAFVASAEHALTCPICYDFFVDPHTPKILECAHTCCQVCLQNMVTLAPGEDITCPMRCEQKTTVPAGGISALKTNLYLKNLAEEHPGNVAGRRPKVSRCARHDEKMHLYCEPCNKLACQNCFILDHQGAGHIIKDIRETTKLQKQELSSLLTATKEEKQTCEKTKTELEQMKMEIITSLQLEKEAVDKCAKETIAAMLEEINREKNCLNEDLDKTAASNLAELDEEVTRLTQHTTELNNVHDIVHQTSTLPDYAYITQHAGIMEKMERLAVKELRNPSMRTNLHPVKFVKHSEVPVRLGRAVKTRQLELVQKLQGFEYAHKVASSSNGLLAVADSMDVIIYQQLNGQYEKNFKLKLNDHKYCPENVCICPDSSFLLSRGNGIEMYSSTGDYQKTIYTHTGNNWAESSLVVLDDGRILSGYDDAAIIRIHNRRGKVIRTISTDVQTEHIVCINNNKVAITDGDKVNVIHIESGEVTLAIDIPGVKGICYDEETQCFFMARVWLEQIEQYCSITGKCIKDTVAYSSGMVLSCAMRLEVKPLIGTITKWHAKC